jgi:hypothetical protein
MTSLATKRCVLPLGTRLNHEDEGDKYFRKAANAVERPKTGLTLNTGL